MDFSVEPAPAATETSAEAMPALKRPRSRRTPWKAFLHLLRRGHLYFGLFLFPWANLYGVTAFLFNHPTAFSDQTVETITFGKDALEGTPMADIPSASETAKAVVAGLQNRVPKGTTYTLLDPDQATYSREFVSASVRAEGQQITVQFDLAGNGGTVRGRPEAPARTPVERAPFAIGGGGRSAGGQPASGRGEGGPRGGAVIRTGDGLKLDQPLHERVLMAVPAVLERAGMPSGTATVAAVPDLTFRMSDGEKDWKVTYNAQAGTVSGRAADAVTTEPLSLRRFLLRLHTAHGYPSSSGGVRWFWAVVVDAMAFVMVFWGLTGLLMWWQIKATRKLGVALILLSAAAATALALALGMHDLMTR